MKRLARYSESLSVGLRFGHHLHEHRRALFVAGGAMLLAAVLEILRPWPIKWILDDALTPAFTMAGTPDSLPESVATIVMLGAAAALLIAVGRSVLDYFGTLKATEVGHAVTRSLRLGIFRHLAELSPAFHARNKSGDLLVRLMGDVQMVRTMLVDSTIVLATRVVLLVGTAAVMIAMDPLMAACVLTLVPVVIGITRLMSRRLTVAVRKQRKKEGALADFLQEAIEASPVIQSLGSSGHTVRRFARSNRRSARAGMKAARAEARLALSVEVTLALAMGGTLALGAWRVLQHHLSPGELIVFLSYVRSIAKPARSASKHMAKIAKGTACGERILAILDEEQEVRSTAGELTAPSNPRTLKFSQVSYTYEDGTSAIEGIDLVLRKGELTALFGPSGAGKSTFICLAMRLFDPTSGSVEMDGIPLDRFDLDSLRTRYALSMQDTVLFGESVRENLLLGKPNATDDELQTALFKAEADGFVAKLPDGIDTVLGSTGAGLSGGERKRLCLARALLRDAPIVIVDEPFTGLDRPTAERLQRTIVQIAKDRIVLVITHEIERLASFDRILFLENGRIRGDGRHEELTRDVRPYARICATASV